LARDRTGITDAEGDNLFVVGSDDTCWWQHHGDAHLIAAAPELLEALKDLLAACEDDCGAVCDLTEFDGDDEPVGGGLNGDGSPNPMTLTFGHLRRAARAIAKAEDH